MDEILQTLSIFAKQVWASPFQQGICCGIAAVILLWILEKILKLILFLLFGPRRCRRICVPGKNGEITVSVEAVSEAVRSQLALFPGIDVTRICLFRRGRGYQLEIRCHYHAALNASGLPAISEQFRPLLTQRLTELFGIRNLSKVRFRVESYDGPPAEFPPEAPEKTETAGENGTL